ncbi:MAG: hypothetical protein ABIQ74_07310 [Chitinophagales bacterium]
MQTLELEVGEVNTADQVMEFFRSNNLIAGDTLRLLTDQQKKNLSLLTVVAFIAIAIEHYFLKEKHEHENKGAKMLDDVFNGKTIEEIEKQIEFEYGVKLEVEQSEDEERRARGILSKHGLSHAYGDDEPDYSDADIKEPNPDYKEWRKVK